MAKVTRETIEDIVKEVLKNIAQPDPGSPTTCRSGDCGVFDSLEEAVAAADKAGKDISTIATREKVINVIRRAAKTNARRFAEMAVDETGMGRVEDKVKKNLLVAERTPGPEIL